MEIYLRLKSTGAFFAVDEENPVEIGGILDFEGPQFGAYGMPRATSRAVEGGSFIGDRRRGGSVNCEEVFLVAHGNGTHTESVGHITRERIPIERHCPAPLLLALHLRCPLVSLDATKETYEGQQSGADEVVTAASVEERVQTLLDSGEHFDEEVSALVLSLERPAHESKLQDFSGTNPPYLTTEAVQWLREKKIDHLLLALPSLDREEDGGRLPNHHRFFGVSPESSLKEGGASEEARTRTITELLLVPASLEEGIFALSLRFPAWGSDAAPSRPILYRLKTVEL